MRILIVNENFGEEGGAERYSLDVADALISRGYEVGFLFSNLKTQSAKLKATTQNSKLSTFGVAGFEIGGVAKVCEEFKPDIIYLQNVFDVKVTKYFRENFRSFRFIHDHATYCPGKSKMWFKQNQICEIPMSLKCGTNAYCKKCMSRRPGVLLREILNKPKLLAENKKLEKLVVASDFMKKQLLLNGVSSNKVLVNPLFVSPDFLNYKEVGIQNKVKSVLFIGRIFIEKGLSYLIEALSLVKTDWELNVIGTGWDLEKCKKMALDLGLEGKINFLGFLSHEKIYPILEKSSLVVVPSIWPEPFCLVGLEAMAMSKPVVAFDVGSISTWLKDNETGFLVKRGDVKEMSEKIELLLEDDNLCKRLGKEGKLVLERDFSVKRHIDELEKEFL